MAELRALSALLLLASLGLAGNAAADCAAPRAQLSPPSGSVVGEKVRIHAFIPQYAQDAKLAVVGDGHALSYRDTVLSDTQGMSTVAIDIDATGKSELKVVYGSVSASYRVSKEPAARTEATIAPVAASHRSHHWPCSYTEARTIELSGPPADAYRVEHARSLEALRAGEAARVTVPPSMRAFWSSGLGDQDDLARAQLELGHISCFGHTADENAVSGTFYARVTPLYHDGPGQTSIDYVVEESRVYPASEPQVRTHEPQPMSCGLAYSHRRPSQQRGFALAWLLSALSGLLMGVAFAWARARRYRRRWVAVVGLLGLGNAGLLSVLAVLSSWTISLALGALGCALVGGLAFGAFARRRS